MLGPTSAGKSEVGLHIAERLGAVILSVDSMQVYRGMDIGTAKPSKEEQARVPHLMIDVADPEDTYTVAEFRKSALERMEHCRHHPLLVVGGSGLHFRALVDPFRFPTQDPEVRRLVEGTTIERLRKELLEKDPSAGTYVDLANPRRVQRAVEILRVTGATPSVRARSTEAEQIRNYRSERPVVAVGIDPGPLLAKRVSERLRSMMEAGLLSEVASLAGRLGRTASKAVGYRHLLPVVGGEISLETGRSEAELATVRLARRQRTYFRRDPRIRWVPWEEVPARRAEAVWQALVG